MKDLTAFIFTVLGVFLFKAMLVDPVVAGDASKSEARRTPAQAMERLK